MTAKPPSLKFSPARITIVKGKRTGQTSKGTAFAPGENPLQGFGDRLRAFREKRGLTQRDLARSLGVTLMLISRYEHGVHIPTAEKIVALARILRVTADALLLGDHKGEEQIPFQNVQLFERMRLLDRLPRAEQATVLDLIDAVLTRHQMKQLVERASSAS